MARRAYSGCGARASHCCGAWALGAQASVVAAPRLWSTGSILVAYRLCCSTAMWDPPGSRIEAMSPALAGRFFTTEPPGKPFYLVFEE